MKNGKHYKCWLHEEYHLVIPAVLQKKYENKIKIASQP